MKHKHPAIPYALAIIFLLQLKSFAQETSPGPESFIVFKEKTQYSLRIKDDVKTNARYCIVLKGKSDTETRYSTDEVLEYQINRNNYYKSFSIKLGNSVVERFLFRIAKSDSAAFYRLYQEGKDLFYIEQNGQLTELKPGKDEEGYRLFQSSLYNAFPGNPWKKSDFTHLRLSNHALEIFADRVESDTWKPLNYTCIGVELVPFGASLFMDRPLAKSDFYLHTVLNYFPKTDQTVMGTVTLQFYVNYAFPAKYVRPFIGVDPFAGLFIGEHEDDGFVIIPVVPLSIQTGIKVPVKNKKEIYLVIRKIGMKEGYYSFGLGLGF